MRPVTVTLLASLLLGGCSFAGRFHLGDLWLEAGQGFALVGNHVSLALH